MRSDLLRQVQKRKGPSKQGSFGEKNLAFLAMSIDITADTYKDIEPPVCAGISLESMTDMRFRKDLRRLYDLLNFPEKVVMDNRSTMTGEEVF